MSNFKKMFLSIVNKQMSHEDLGMFNLVKKKKKKTRFCKNGVGRQKLVILVMGLQRRTNFSPRSESRRKTDVPYLGEGNSGH